MHVYRIANTRYIADIYGTGGLYHSGRWHIKGTSILSTAGSVALAKLEVLANSLLTPIDQALLTLEIPDDIPYKILTPTELPLNWSNYPPPANLVTFTEAWIKENKHLVMQVPSAQSEMEFNYLINPRHSDHYRLQVVNIKPHTFDPRLKGDKL